VKNFDEMYKYFGKYQSDEWKDGQKSHSNIMHQNNDKTDSTSRPKPAPRQLILIKYYSCPYLALVKILSKISGSGLLSRSTPKSNQLLLVTHPTPLKHFLLTYKSAKAKT